LQTEPSGVRQGGWLRTVLRRAAASDARAWSDAALMILFGGIGWPWLLRSLGSGDPRARAELTAITGLEDAAFGALGSWRADADLLLLLAELVRDARPATVVEVGGGISTLVIAQMLSRSGGGRLLSIDGDARFAAETRRKLSSYGLSAEVRAVPLVRPRQGVGRWYDHGPLPDAIDLLVVDGPPWFLHPMGRGNADVLFARIVPGGSVVLDDAARPGERLVAARWSSGWPEFDWRFVANTAGTLIGTRRA
jgi:predicted O-methyltransferase YrrM